MGVGILARAKQGEVGDEGIGGGGWVGAGGILRRSARARASVGGSADDGADLDAALSLREQRWAFAAALEPQPELLRRRADRGHGLQPSSRPGIRGHAEEA